jgi:hypothetical protein
MSQSEASSTSEATPSISGQPDSIGDSQPKAASTGPRTAHGKRRSARNASKHNILVDRILPEEAKAAAYICEELLKRRRIDRHNINAIGKARWRYLESYLETEERSQAEQWRRYADTRSANSADWKRLPPEACVRLLGALRASVQKRGPLPEEDLEALGRVYGQEPTALGAMITFFYHILQSNKYHGNERDEQSKVEDEKLREEILEALEAEIQLQQGRVERRLAIAKAESSLSVVVPPSSAEDSIQRYYAANAREFTHLLDALERVRRLRKLA